jgi:hypothetical protein
MKGSSRKGLSMKAKKILNPALDREIEARMTTDTESRRLRLSPTLASLAARRRRHG